MLTQRYCFHCIVVSYLVVFRFGSGSAPGAETDVRAPLGMAATLAEHHAVRESTRKHFTRATLIMPARSSGGVRDRIWMAPLLVHEVAPARTAGASFERFGAVTGQPGPASIDTNRLTVYLITRAIRVGSRRYRQETYVWFYPPADGGKPPRWRGFRQTVNSRGFALVWETLSSRASLRVFFVAKSLEKSAARQFGPPLPGRCYSVEPDCNDHPDVVVARLVGEGPQPMGPYIYLDRESMAVTTMKCRCEPSQVYHFTTSLHYRLVPIESIADLPAGDARPPNGNLPADAGPLDGILRLPPTM